jgi:hypothetical protein
MVYDAGLAAAAPSPVWLVQWISADSTVFDDGSLMV